MFGETKCLIGSCRSPFLHEALSFDLILVQLESTTIYSEIIFNLAQKRRKFAILYFQQGQV